MPQMNDKAFIDTNVFVYLYSEDETETEKEKYHKWLLINMIA